MRPTVPPRISIALLAALIVICTTAARAEVQKFLNPCGGQKLCAS